MLIEEKLLEEFKKWSLDNGILGWTKPNTTHEKVKIELVNGNTSQRVLTYKANTTTIYAVYPSLCSAPICWAGRVDSCLSRYPHEIAFVGVTIEEAAREFKKWIDACELGRKAITEQAPPRKKKISLVDVIIAHETAKGTPEALAYAACLSLVNSARSGDDE